jgi:predicted Zn finger-like uncharacterized protein
MNVRCPSCRTVFRVDPQKVPEAGIRARCTVCAATIEVRRDGAAAHPAAPAIPAPAPVAPPAVPVSPPVASRLAAPTVETTAVSPAPLRPGPATTRLSQPFSQPRAPRPPIAPAPPAAPPSRPAAPVFRPTPGQPVTAPPVPPPQPIARPAPAPPAAAPATPRPAAPVEAPKRPVNPFLQQDPQQKARRLARALVSDMIVYQPEKRQRALSAGNLKEAFEEEIQKSWEEYVEQVGEEMAASTSYWRDALNEILAGGQPVF